MKAILVVVLVLSSGNNWQTKYFAFPSMKACERAIETAVLADKPKDDGRGVQAMFCIPSDPDNAEEGRKSETGSAKGAGR